MRIPQLIRVDIDSEELSESNADVGDKGFSPEPDKNRKSRRAARVLPAPGEGPNMSEDIDFISSLSLSLSLSLSSLLPQQNRYQRLRSPSDGGERGVDPSPLSEPASARILTGFLSTFPPR